jgi:hypothetical protein
MLAARDWRTANTTFSFSACPPVRPPAEKSLARAGDSQGGGISFFGCISFDHFWMFLAMI